MNTVLIISQLSKAGLKFQAVEGQLQVWPKELITEILRAQIKQQKDNLLTFYEHWQERAAMMSGCHEYANDAEAEQAAFHDTINYFKERERYE